MDVPHEPFDLPSPAPDRPSRPSTSRPPHPPHPPLPASRRVSPFSGGPLPARRSRLGKLALLVLFLGILALGSKLLGGRESTAAGERLLGWKARKELPAADGPEAPDVEQADVLLSMVGGHWRETDGLVESEPAHGRVHLPHQTYGSNLAPGVRYATTAVAHGFHNQLVSLVMLLAYARAAGRTAVVGPFEMNENIAAQVREKGWKTPGQRMPFDKVFDLVRYRNLTSDPVETFASLQPPPPSTEDAHLPCFSLSHRAELPALEYVPRPAAELGLHWRPANSVQVDVWDGPLSRPWGELHALEVDDLVRFSEDADVWRDAVNSHALRANGVEGEPHQNFVCWTDLYWIVNSKAQGFRERWSDDWPAWRAVGTHLHFTPELQALAEEHLRTALGIGKDDALRPFIGIHSRHGDFGCRSSARAQSDQKPIGDALCHARPSTYLPHVVSLRATLSAQGADVGEDDVVVFSDETDERWWAGLPDGWKRVDHDALGTEVKRDAWWPTLIDMAVLSLAKGFIGTPDSTYSLFAARRVTDWNQGVAVEVA